MVLLHINFASIHVIKRQISLSTQSAYNMRILFPMQTLNIHSQHILHKKLHKYDGSVFCR